LPCGRIRIRERGRDGGHNGLKSIIETLGTSEFARVRIGVGPKPGRDEMVRFVLSDFTETDRKTMAAALRKAADAIRSVVEQGPETAMNKFNT
jgi:PTH1 family peptidyl-tRNA hydrolase